MSSPICALCKVEPGPFFWCGSPACNGCYLSALERWRKRVGQVLEAAERGLVPQWVAEKDLDIIAGRQQR